MTRPVVGVLAEETYDSLKAGIIDEDTDATTGWSTLMMCQALIQDAELAASIAREDDDGNPGWSSVLDIVRCPPALVPWLAQFVGVTVPSANTDAQNRNLILTRPGWARGRPASLIAAVQDTLVGGKHCVLDERDSSPYHATIVVRTAECPDQAATRAAIAANKPGDIIVALQVNDGPSYGEIRTATDGTYGGRESTFPTYGDVAAF